MIAPFGKGALAHDFIIVAGKRSPGIAIVSGAELEMRIDAPGGYGLSGATLKTIGTKLVEFQALIQLWEPEHFDEWEQFQKVLLPRNSATGALSNVKPAPALTFHHPATDPLGVKAVVVKKIGQVERLDETGLYGVTVRFLEFRQPKPHLNKPIASRDDGPPSPQDAADKLILDLATQVQDLAKPRP